MRKIRDQGYSEGGFIVAGIVALLLIIGGTTIAFHNSETQVSITVTDKDRVCDSSGDCKYLVFTDNEVFKNTDAASYGKFRSSDIQGRLKVGETYDVTVAGWRIPVFSSYRNIIRIN